MNALLGPLEQILVEPIDPTNHTASDLYPRSRELETILDILPVGVWQADRACEQIVGNRAGYEMFGLPFGINVSLSSQTELPTELAAIKFLVDGREVPPDQLPMQRAAFLGESVSHLPHQAILPSGDVRVIDANVVPLRDAHGELCGAVAAYHDITELKRAEAALRHTHEELEQRVLERTEQLTAANAELINENKERRQAQTGLTEIGRKLEMLLDSITDQFFAFDDQWRFTYLNRHAQEQMQVLGKDPVGLIGKVLWDEFPYVPNEAAVRRVMAERVAVTDELYYPPLGQWVENHMCPTADGGLVTFQRYVTDRKQYEEFLRLSEERLRLLVEGVTDYAVFMLDLTGHVMTWNTGAQRIKGYEAQEIIGKHFSRFYPLDAIQRGWPQHALEVTAEQGRFEDEGWRIRKDGTRFWAHVIISALYDGGGRRRGFGKVTRDLTERKLAEEALHKAQAELARVARVAALGELTASIAHEINQPLAAIVADGGACLRWLAQEVPNLQEVRDSAGRVIRSGHRAGRVIAQIRKLTTNTEPQKSEIDVNETIQELVSLIGEELRSNGVALRMDLGVGLPRVLGDQVALQQVVLNLVMNAVEAMSTMQDCARVLVIQTGREEGAALRVAVQDSGIGFGEEQMQCLFEAFYTTKIAGMGIGLSLSRSIVEAHGGRIWASNNEPSGASVQFTLPASSEAAHRDVNSDDRLP